MADMLADLESLSDEEVERLLAQERSEKIWQAQTPATLALPISRQNDIQASPKLNNLKEVREHGRKRRHHDL
jgi:hypothetical protein